MNPVLRFACLLFLASCGTNKAVYQSPDFSTVSARHKTIAILPVRLIQSGYVAKNISEDDVHSTNESLGFVFQETLQTFILKQTAKNKDGQPVSFQSTQKTNALLKESGLTIENMYDKQPEELARLLGVDAVIMTTLNHNKNISDGLAYGISAAKTIVGAVSKKPVTVAGVNAADVKMACSLYNAADSKLLWKTYREGGTELPSDINGLINYYSNWIAKKLPYKS